MSEFMLWLQNLTDFISAAGLAVLVRSVLLLLIGVPVVFALSRWGRKYVSKRYSAQQGMIVDKVVTYVGLLLIGFTLFHELGFSLGPLLGAAGIFGIAIGFASQTSVSNIISGFFLIAEKPFVVGDVISIGDTTGQILSIDMLSVKLRTFDNKFVRIPNENIIKSQVTNITHFPIRRADLAVSVAYKENIARVKDILLELTAKNPLCLQEPEPIIIFKEFGSSSIDLTLAVWAQRSDFLKLRNSLQEEIKERFDQEGIEIPFPHMSLYAGEATKPISVKMVE